MEGKVEKRRENSQSQEDGSPEPIPTQFLARRNATGHYCLIIWLIRLKRPPLPMTLILASFLHPHSTLGHAPALSPSALSPHNHRLCPTVQQRE